MRFPKLYECDPQKNTECNKRNCGNPCKHTTRKEFAREPSGSELLGKVVVITQMRKIPTACAYCKYYENMGGNRGRGSDGACTARGTLYAAAEFLAVLIVTAVVFTKGLSAALAWRGYKAVGGEFMLLLLPIIYYEAKRIILDFVADFVELYRRAED